MLSCGVLHVLPQTGIIRHFCADKFKPWLSAQASKLLTPGGETTASSILSPRVPSGGLRDTIVDNDFTAFIGYEVLKSASLAQHLPANGQLVEV